MDQERRRRPAGIRSAVRSCPGEIDAGDYQPRPDDIKKLVDLDAIVINGIGHDDFIMPMLKASGNKKVVIIRPNEMTPQIHAAHGSSVNSHTFISFTNAIQQTYAIQKALAALRPQDAAALQRNAGEYARRLRLIKSKAAQQLAEAKITRVVTVHDGYGYLLQEFGLEVAGRRAAGARPDAVGRPSSATWSSCCSVRRFASCSAKRRSRRRC